MSGAAAGHQSYLAGLEMPALHEWRMLADVHKVGMRRAESGKAFVHHILGGVDQLLHSGLPVLVASASAVLDQPCDFLRELAQERVKLVVLLFAPQIRQHQCETPAALSRSFRRSSRRGCA